MNHVAIAFSTKDRVELTKRTLEPLLQPGRFDLHWVDGSQTAEGCKLQQDSWPATIHAGVIGGSCRAIVYALTTLLKDLPKYTHVGLCENDVLLDKDWFEPTMELFERGARDGLKVGAVSARCYEDRVLLQRDGYAVMHNLGAGMIIFTREAAQLILQTYRTGMTGENRRIFSIVSGIDIGAFWAFRGAEHMLCADWTWDHILACHGMSSLALTPAKAEQLEDIASMGLKMVKEPVEVRRDERTFSRYRETMACIRENEPLMPYQPGHRLFYDGVHTIFPHQMAQLGGVYEGDWRFKWSIGFGCFSWKAGEGVSTLTIPIFGPCEVLVSGGPEGGKVRVEDTLSGFSCEPDLQAEGPEGRVLQLAIPGAVSYRSIRITALKPCTTFYGIRMREAQPFFPDAKFDFNRLPPL